MCAATHNLSRARSHAYLHAHAHGLATTGVWQTLVMILLVFVMSMVTILSTAGICNTCRLKKGGVYAIIKQALGTQIGKSARLFCEVRAQCSCAIVTFLAIGVNVLFAVCARSVRANVPVLMISNSVLSTVRSPRSSVREVSSARPRSSIYHPVYLLLCERVLQYQQPLPAANGLPNALAGCSGFEPQ